MATKAPTPYAEANIVLFAMNADVDNVRLELEMLYPGERRMLARALEVVLEEIQDLEDGD